MERKPYKGRSLTGAIRRVRELQKLVDQYRELFDRWYEERKLLAKLAATGPCFYDPLEAMAAEELRDDILRNCRLMPDGSAIK